uniref:Uncharacterized protein n=1 Tax=Desulfobacca acetoxidans TaxID=60893 RepID=A0A7V4G7Q2_9BACT
MNHIRCNENHILVQVQNRYNIHNATIMLRRVKKALATQAPRDWRFTQSPSARFFVVDLDTKVKILGVSYRDWGTQLVESLQKAISEDKVEDWTKGLEGLLKEYLEALANPRLDIVHDLRTAYPPQKGEIGEEKRILAAIKEQLAHPIVLMEKKLSARPNAIVVSEQELWVRQHLNWVNPKNPNKEYFLFELLTPLGINKAQRKIFSYTANGEVREELDGVAGCPQGSDECLLRQPTGKLLTAGHRTDAYWTLPTYPDRRLMDLEFREREPDKAEEGPLRRNEIVELYILRKLVEAARKKFLKR